MTIYRLLYRYTGPKFQENHSYINPQVSLSIDKKYFKIDIRYFFNLLINSPQKINFEKIKNKLAHGWYLKALTL